MERGQIVCAKAGRDKNDFFVVVNMDSTFCYLCNGKERPLERPKRKNLKHVQCTNSRLDEEKLRSNRSIKQALRAFRAGVDEFSKEE